MSIEPIEYLDLAKELIGEPPTNPVTQEALYRSAISRAYYAVFLKARDYLYNSTRTPIRFDGTDHRTVKNAFLFHPTDGKMKRIGRYIDFLLEQRTFADYNDPIQNLPQLTKTCVLWAEEAYKWLDQL